MNENDWIKLPVKWVAPGRTEDELVELEQLGVDTDDEDYSKDGYIYVNIHQIVAFNSSSKGRTTLRLGDGNAYDICYDLATFKQRIFI